MNKPTVNPLALVSDVASSIKTSGFYCKELSPTELEQLVRAVVGLVAKTSSVVNLSIKELVVGFSGEKRAATVNGLVSISKPILLDVGLRMEIANHPKDKGRLSLKAIGIDERPQSFGARLAVKTFNISKKIKDVLSDPSKALTEVLQDQLVGHSVVLGKCQYEMRPNGMLKVYLAGQ